MGQRKLKQYRKAVRKEADKIGGKTLDDVFIHISAKPFFSRLKWCLRVAFKMHTEQKRLSEKIAAHREEIKAKK
jgi:hypothetical protein